MLNRFGVCTDYFRDRLERVIDGLPNYTAEELARELVRAAAIADLREMHKEADTVRFARQR